MITPPEVEQAARDWVSLTRWERAELGRGLRRSGWTYGEIMDVLPVGKGTLAGWCKDIRLSEDQIAAIKARVPSQKGIPKDTNWKRRLEIEEIRAEARQSFLNLYCEPSFVAGVTMYWVEGAKTLPRLGMANTDPRVLRLLSPGSKSISTPTPTSFWHSSPCWQRRRCREAMVGQCSRVRNAEFHRTFVKPPGTGHRKNRWLHGVCRVQMRRSANAYNTTMEWIDCLAQELSNRPADTLSLGR